MATDRRRPAKAGFAGSRSSIRVGRNRKFMFTFHATPGLTGTAAFKSVKQVRVTREKKVALSARGSETSPLWWRIVSEGSLNEPPERQPGRPRRRGKRRQLLVAWTAAATLAAVVLAPAAIAGRPPLGNYNCYRDGDVSRYTLSFNLKSKIRYRTPDGPGAYSYRRRTKLLIFKSGPFKRNRWYGKHRHLRGGRQPAIELFGEVNGNDFLLQCLRGRLN